MPRLTKWGIVCVCVCVSVWCLLVLLCKVNINTVVTGFALLGYSRLLCAGH